MTGASVFRKTDWTDEMQASYMAERKRAEDQMKPEIERIDREAKERLAAMRHLSGEDLDSTVSSIKDEDVRRLVQNLLDEEEMNAWLKNMSEEEKAEMEAIDAESLDGVEERIEKSCRVFVRSYGEGLMPLYPACCGINTPGSQEESSCIGRSGDSICSHYAGHDGDYVLCANTSSGLHHFKG